MFSKNFQFRMKPRTTETNIEKLNLIVIKYVLLIFFFYKVISYSLKFGNKKLCIKTEKEKEYKNKYYIIHEL